MKVTYPILVSYYIRVYTQLLNILVLGTSRRRVPSTSNNPYLEAINNYFNFYFSHDQHGVLS